MNKRILAGVAFGIIVIIPAFLTMRMAADHVARPLVIGTLAPKVSVAPLSGAALLPSQVRRVLVFFDPSCPHCQELLNEMRETPAMAPSPIVPIQLISTGSRTDTSAMSLPVQWPTYLDQQRTSLHAMGSAVVPFIVFVDEHDRVAYRHAGVLSAARLDSLLTQFRSTGEAR